MEPSEDVLIQSIIGDHLPNVDFSDKQFKVKAVLPQRTMLEKAFLLHEMLQNSTSVGEVNRMSRHLYDLEKLMKSAFCDDALKNSELYYDIINHRKLFTSMSGVDYATHRPETICFVPSADVLKSWEKDYLLMQENMIYGDSLSFSALIERIKELNKRFNSTKF
jgi:hypothetical protein